MPFASVIGHAPVLDVLRHAVSKKRVPQSLLFAGPDGVGKRIVAVALAQAVNCPNQKDGDACGTCSTCSRIARGQHSDVTLIDKGDEASIKIKALRERVLDTVHYRPFEASHRVYVIDGADDMTLEAQDALLKTLEEPPRAAILILISAYPDTLLSTIRSRCRRLRFGWLLEKDVARVLIEREKMDPALARKLAAASGGSVSRALAEESGDFDDDRDAVLALLSAAGGKPVPVRLKAAAALAQHGGKRRDRDALAERLAILLSLLRDLGALNTNGPVPLANGDVADTLRGLLPAFSSRRVSQAFGVVEQAERYLQRNSSPKLVADWVAVTI